MKINGKGLAALLLAVASIIAYLGLNLYPKVTASLKCVGDAFVYSDMPNLNTGSYDEAQASITWQDSTPTNLRYIYFMFDVSSIPSYAIVQDVRLQVYVTFVSTLNRDPRYGYVESEKGQMYAVSRAETNWAESTITWNKQPSTGIPGSPHSHLFGGKYGFKSGWFTWQLGFYSQYVMDHLKTDKKVAFVLFPDIEPFNRRLYCDTSFIIVATREKGGGFEPKLFIDYTIPSFRLTVSVKDSDGAPVQGASVTSPFTATTDASGTVSSTITGGTYTVSVSYKGYTFTQSVTLDSNKTVSFTIPKYTLTVKVVDAQDNPLPGATVSGPATGTTNAQGIFTVKLPKGQYLVRANIGTKEALSFVELTSDKTVTLKLEVEFTLQLIVKDQCGNPLQATVTVDGQSVTCDKKGTAVMAVPSGTRTVQALVRVGDRTFNVSRTVSVNKHMPLELVIYRRFYWTFYFNYTDGTVPSKGTITLTHPKEVLKVPLINGVGEAYLLDGTYRITVEASPAVDLGTITVKTDGELFYTLNKATARIEEKSENPIPTTEDETPVTPPPPPTQPEIPWVLIPSIYIYTLIGVLAFGFIVAAVVSMRRKQ
ncbi:MAG: DNRLRE domain-containing protein [Candidatus Bathyarchaeota archaeon]|nr:DNRLRE domain-containing protein [Candidatus Bathyarchaeota archaeon]MDW8022364.1 DNRLRE domain-containing protein [Nitrososphaerota archaeon]